MNKINLNSQSITNAYKDAINANSMVCIMDENGLIAYVNKAFCQKSRYSKTELKNQSFDFLFHPSVSKKTAKNLASKMQNKETFKEIIKLQDKNKDEFIVQTTIVPVFENDQLIAFINISQDLTEIFEYQKLKEGFTIDKLTSLPNKEQLIQDIENRQGELMLALVNINHFDEICNIYGDSIGDELLLQSKETLKEFVFDDGVSLYKLDFNVFGFLITKKNLFGKYVSVLNNYVLFYEGEVVLSKKFDVKVVVSYTIGYAVASKNLFRKAFMTLKKAQDENKNIEEYSSDFGIEEINKKNIAQLSVLKNALENDNIMPFFQPMVSAKTGKIQGFEAVARAVDEAGNIFSPNVFLDIAKESRLYHYFTIQMMRKVFAVASLNPGYKFSINMSFSDIDNPNICSYVENRLQKFPNTNITFEILESEEIINYQSLIKFTQMVKSYGKQIAIDDFGSGYSNFANIAKIDIDIIKIDGTIVSSVLDDEDSVSIIKAVCYLAKTKNIQTTAEFVSSKEIVDVLKELDLDFYQGYYFGEPKPAKDYGLKE